MDAEIADLVVFKDKFKKKQGVCSVFLLQKYFLFCRIAKKGGNMRQSQSGRSVLETMMVMGIIGMLSVTGLYLYKRAITDVYAEGIMKDVLARALQKKGNKDLELKSFGMQRKRWLKPTIRLFLCFIRLLQRFPDVKC